MTQYDAMVITFCDSNDSNMHNTMKEFASKGWSLELMVNFKDKKGKEYKRACYMRQVIHD